MLHRLWRKDGHRKASTKGKDSACSDSETTSSSQHSRVSAASSTGHEDILLATLGTPEWLTFSRMCFDASWSSHHAESSDLSKFRQVKRLASGSFGPIILLRHNDTGDHHVLKVLQKRVVYKLNQIQKARTEKRILMAINFPFLVNLQWQGQDSVNLYLVMEYLPGGDLWHLMQRNKAVAKCFGEADVRFYVSQVILALEYLHRMDIVYRDLKPENIFIDANGYLKIGDFGCSKRLRNDGRARTHCGTTQYMAPEIVTRQLYTRAVDYWSLGVLLYEFIRGETPFSGRNQMETYEKIVTGRYTPPRNVSRELRDLIQKLLVVDSWRRLGNWKNGFMDLKMHDWFVRSKFSWERILQKGPKAPFVPQLRNAGDTKYFTTSVNSDFSAPPNPHHLFKQQETPNFVDHFDKYFEDF